MAESSKEKTKAVPAETVSVMSIVAPALGWLIPGAGHMIQKRWIRGALLFISVVTMFLLGLSMQGRIYNANGGDILSMLGCVSVVGGGPHDIPTVVKHWGQGAVAIAHTRANGASSRPLAPER